MTEHGRTGGRDHRMRGTAAAGLQWSFSFGNGFLGTDLVGNDLYAMVYYPGPATPGASHGGPPSPPHKPGAPITCS